MLLNGLILEGRKILGSLRHPKQILGCVLLGYLVVALLGFGAFGSLLHINWDLAVGILVISAMPTSLASGILWTRMAQGNDALALVMTVFSNVLGFLVTPIILFLTLGSLITLSLDSMIGRFTLVLLLPVALGQILRLVNPVATTISQFGRTLSNTSRLLILLAVSGAVVSGVIKVEGGEQISPFELVTVAIAVVTVHLLAAAICWFLGKFLHWNREDRTAFLFCGSQKTLPASLYVCTEFLPNIGLAPIPCVLYHLCQLLLDSWLVEVLRSDGLDTNLSGKAT